MTHEKIEIEWVRSSNRKTWKLRYVCDLFCRSLSYTCDTTQVDVSISGIVTPSPTPSPSPSQTPALYTLAITSPKTSVFPDNTSGDPKMTLVAALTASQSGTVLAGRLIPFSVTPKENTGGHLHPLEDRPMGTIFPETCVTGSDGMCSVQYRAPEVGGVETISAKLTGNNTSSNALDIKAEVPGLGELAADTYNTKCALDPNTSSCPAGGYQHENFYSVTTDVNTHMSKIGSDYSAGVPEGPDLVVTDASLASGGLYDYMGTWAPPHKYHRQGTDIDVRRATISDEEIFQKVVCKNEGFPFPENSAHYHLYFYNYGNSASIRNLCEVP
jgi:hypothetical protein